MTDYRIIISHVAEKNNYIAKAPELENCVAEGETRAAAIAKLEEEMTAQIANMKEQDIELPEPLESQEFDGNLAIKVTPALHKELVFNAKVSEVEMEVYLTELLTRGVSGRRGYHGKPRSGGQGRRQEGQGKRYNAIMENRADFIEYVRGLDSGEPRGGKGGRRGGKR